MCSTRFRSHRRCVGVAGPEVVMLVEEGNAGWRGVLWETYEAEARVKGLCEDGMRGVED